MKQAQEVLFSNKATKTNHPNILFNRNTVQNSANQKHLGIILDEKLTFNEQSFIIPHLDYSDVIFDKTSNATFYNRIESPQYNAALAITETIRGKQ